MSARRGIRIALLLLLSLSSLVVPARAADDGGTQSPFTLGTGARSLGMGATGVASADGASTVFWNPARLGWVERSELSLFRTRLFVDGAGYHTGFLAYPTLDFGGFGLGYQRLDVSDLDARDDRNRSLGSFEESESNLLMAYGRGFGPHVAAGVGLKIAQQSVGDASAVGVGVDVGMAVRRGLDLDQRHALEAGALVRNALEPTLRLEEEEVPDPRSLLLGLAYRADRVAASGHLGWTLSTQLDLPRMADPRWGMGAELRYDDLLALRAGTDAGRVTLGFGLAWRGLALDYALRNDEALPRNDRFTLAWSFGPAMSERRVAREERRQREVFERLEELLAQREREELERVQRDAEQAHDARRWEESIRLHRRLMALDPGRTEAQERIAKAQLELRLAAAGNERVAGEYARAAAAYQSILDTWPDELRAREGLDSARESLRRSADRERLLETLFKDALGRFTEGNLDAAEASLAELLRLDPEHALGRELRDRVRSGRRAAGEELLRRARDLAERGDHAEALRRLTEARALLPDRGDLDGLAEQWIVAQEAQLRLERESLAARTVTPPPEPSRPRRISAEERRDLQRRYEEGMRAFGAGDFERAILRWRAVWVEAPDFEQVDDYLVKAYLLEGVSLFSRGDYDQALERCDRVLEIEPRNEKARRYRARILEEKQELEQIGGSRGR